MAVEDKTIKSGSATVHLKGEKAIKKLNGNKKDWQKDDRSKEKYDRFCREIDALDLIQKELNLENVVKIEAFDKEAAEYTMRRYDGAATNFFNETKGNVELVSKLLIPVVETLKLLAERGVFHRDLKTDNLLVDASDSTNLKLILADFGCVWVKEYDSRLTDDYRAVGAMHFRAPEYQYGKVEDVTEAGDVFSIGKIIWAMVNGVFGAAFPYTLWFPPEYNLANRFPDAPGIQHLNLLIAACVHYDPEKRISYTKLLDGLKQVTEEQKPVVNTEKIAQLEYEARQELHASEKEAVIKNLINHFGIAFREALTRLKDENGGSKIFSELLANLSLVYPMDVSRNSYMKGTDTPLWKARSVNIQLNSRIYPNGSHGNKVGALMELHCISTNQNGDTSNIRLGYFWNSSNAMQQTCDGEIFDHDANRLYEVIQESVRFLRS